MVIENAAGNDELLEQSADSPEGQADQAEGAPVETPSSEAPEQTEQHQPADEPDPSDISDSAAEPDAGVEADLAEDDDADFDASDEFEGEAEPIELVEELVADEEIDLKWFILKVASNRENSIADALRRRVKVEGLDNYFGQIIVPTEDVAEFKNGKKKITKRKLYPGYICAQLHVNDDTWFAVRDTPGIGDFTGAAGKPTPMLDHEVERILPKKEDPDAPDKVKSVIKFKVTDRVRIKEGTFENFEGEVDAVDEANGRVTVVINIFDRPTPVEIDHWQLEAV